MRAACKHRPKPLEFLRKMNNVARLAKIFQKHNKQIFLVGGSVRDRLLGRDNHDLDLTTDALPGEVKSFAAEARPDAVNCVGERFGTIGLIFGDQVIEITTFRSEWYNPDSRKPEVCFGTSLEEDLARRDFTINAIAQDLLTGTIIDPFAGQDDLGAKIIRAVGDPEERFQEDPLRLLRMVRLAAQLGFTIEPRTRKACVKMRSRLTTVSQERIAEEMNKLLVAPSPARGIRFLCNLRLMELIIPEILAMRGLVQDDWHHKDVFEHTLGVLENTPADLVLRWAALLHDIAKPATRRRTNGEIHFYGHEHLGAEMSRTILYRLRFDKQTIDRVVRLIRMHLRINQYEDSWTDGAVRRLIREAREELEPLFALSRADVTSHRPEKVELALARVAELEQRCQELTAKENVAKLTSPLDGHELMAMFGRPPGPWIKKVKDHLLSLVLDGTLAPEDKATAERLAREYVAENEA
ncbi:MAG: CCA tRNA nucleotidyltransferase [Chloroflexi bacterium]|nr:CCA tRNA nucleotidyltransferase [Chloroflexota bacterium]MCL5074045.1 CCA tRNA nucleotidyltransferase [Chloroflexota bacterium]